MRAFQKYFETKLKNHKNSEMISFGNVASSHSGLIPLKTTYKKKRGITLGDRELEEFN